MESQILILKNAQMRIIAIGLLLFCIIFLATEHVRTQNKYSSNLTASILRPKEYKQKIKSVKRFKPNQKKQNNKRKYQVKVHFQKRKKHLEDICAKYNKQSFKRKEKLKIFSIEPRKKLIVCRTAKHGSTTWSNILFKMHTGK